MCHSLRRFPNPKTIARPISRLLGHRFEQQPDPLKSPCICLTSKETLHRAEILQPASPSSGCRSCRGGNGGQEPNRQLSESTKRCIGRAKRLPLNLGVRRRCPFRLVGHASPLDRQSRRDFACPASPVMRGSRSSVETWGGVAFVPNFAPRRTPATGHAFPIIVARSSAELGP